VFRKTLAVGLAAAATIGLAACGDDNNDSGNGQSSTPAPARTQPAITTGADTGGTSAGGGATFAIAADPSGQLAYDKKRANVKAGNVTIDFTNQSPTPHNVELEGPSGDVGGTETISNDEAKETVKLKPGEYTYYCSVGNHRQAGMEGTLTVK
jgi:plastocyanin